MAELKIIPALHRATHRVGMRIASALPHLELTQGEAHLLAHLVDRRGACTVADLHAAFAHKRSTLTSHLDRLEERGFVTRGRHPLDRRSFLVRLTPAGAAAAGEVHDLFAALERDIGARAAEKARDVLDALAAEEGR